MLGDFRRLLVSRFFYTLASDMQAVVVGWRTYELTGDPIYLGLIGLAEAVPALGLALYAGYVVDRSRPVLAFRAVIGTALLSAAVLLVAHPLERTGALATNGQLVALYLASVLSGVGRAFAQPSILSIVPRLLPRESLGRASAWLTTAAHSSHILGPALGGLLFGFFGAAVTFSSVVLAVTISLVSALLMDGRLPAPAAHGEKRSRSEELLSGLRFVFRHRLLLPAMSLDMISVLFGGVTALLPIFAKDVLFVGPKGLGALRAAPAVGAVLSALLMTRVYLRHRAGPVLLGCVSGFGICILVFAASRSFALSLAALGLSGAFDAVSTVIRGTAVTLASPDHLRGRVSAVNSMFIGSSNELGELESGLAAKLLGTVPAVYFGGVMCLLTVLALGVLSPALRKLDLDEI